MQLTFFNFLKEQCATVPPAPHEDLSGKTIIVLGANTGIGFETAKHFASMSPGKLILGCRDQTRGDEALQKIKQETGCKTVEVSIIDLESFESVNAFVDRFERTENQLDILVANAAIVLTKLTTTADGWETCFQVNNLSTNLLCLLLLPTMLQTSQQHRTSPRVVVVTSDLHYFSKPANKVLESPNPVAVFGRQENITQKDVTNRYFDSKLLNILFVRALNERLGNHSIIASAVNPGLCATTIRKEFTGLRRFFIEQIVVRLLARTAEEGSRRLLWASIGAKDDPDRLRGVYVSSMEIYEPSDFIVNEQGRTLQDNFWNDMLKELVGVNNKVAQIVSSYLKD
ncbi:short-chain dehydrogenase [Panaeolus papilionaceus]|nr:short-chain dehydrogenase [Panaeolus papilionaceus]